MNQIFSRRIVFVTAPSATPLSQQPRIDESFTFAAEKSLRTVRAACHAVASAHALTAAVAVTTVARKYSLGKGTFKRCRLSYRPYCVFLSDFLLSVYPTHDSPVPHHFATQKL